MTFVWFRADIVVLEGLIRRWMGYGLLCEFLLFGLEFSLNIGEHEGIKFQIALYFLHFQQLYQKGEQIVS